MIFNGSGDILLDAEFNCFQYTDNVIINDGYVYCYTSQDSVFGDDTIIEVNGGKLQLLDGGCWDKFLCNGMLTIAAGNVYVNADPRKIELADCVPWDGVTNLNTYDCVWIVDEQAVSNITVNCIGDIDYTVSGNVVIVTHDKPCKLGYANADGKYVTLTAIKNSDGSYALTVPTDVTEVILAVKGGISGDGRINVGDVSKLYAHVKQTNPLSGDTLFIADISGDNRINVGDVSKLYASVKQTAPLTWDI